jgi:hypothetical protein
MYSSDLWRKWRIFHKIFYDYHTSRYHPTFIIVNIIGILILLRFHYFTEPTLKRVNCLNSLKFYFKFYTHFALEFWIVCSLGDVILSMFQAPVQSRAFSYGRQRVWVLHAVTYLILERPITNYEGFLVFKYNLQFRSYLNISTLHFH